MAPRYDTCFNPFKICNHGKKPMKNLRRVTSDLRRKLKVMLPPSEILKICDACRIKTRKILSSDSESTESMMSEKVGSMSKPGPSSRVTDSDSSVSNSGAKIEKLNKTLALLNESPINKNKLLQKKYPAAKQIIDVTDKKIFHIENEDNEENSEEDIEICVISKLKEEFKKTEDKQLQLRILTIFADWSYRQIQNHFDASKHMITVAKNLAQQKGILSSPNSKAGKTLDQDVVKKVVEFYESQEISREMPGKKDCVTIRTSEEKVKEQKRLVLCNLKEAYAKFKEMNPHLKVHFSKFAALRPKYCILAGASGTHAVCVCCIHQNVKLMIDGAQLSKITGDSLNLKTYNDLPFTHNL